MENALIHHMASMHGMHVTPGQMQPLTVMGTPAQGGPSAGAQEVQDTAVDSQALQKQFAKSQVNEKALPPEEADISVHLSCVNQVVLVGKCHDVQKGFVQDVKVTQFTVHCPWEGSEPPVGEAQTDKIVVRCGAGVNEEAVKVGSVVCVIGQLRMNPQMESMSSKYYYFPIVTVTAASGSVTSVSQMA